MATKSTAKKTAKNKTTKESSYLYDTITALTLLLLSVLVIISLVSDLIGPVGKVIQSCLLGLFGAGAIIFPLILIYIAAVLFSKKNHALEKFSFSVIFLTLFSAFYNVCVFTANLRGEEVFSDYFADLTSDLWKKGATLASGGVLGGWLSQPLVALCAKVGAGIIIFAVMLAFFVLATGITPSMLIRKREYEDTPKKSPSNKEFSKDIKNIRKDIDSIKKSLPKEKEIKKPKKEDVLIDIPQQPQFEDVDSILNEIERDYILKIAKSNKLLKKHKPEKVVSENTATLSKNDLDDILIDFDKKPKITPLKKPKETEEVNIKAEEKVEEIQKIDNNTEEEPLKDATVEISEQKAPTDINRINEADYPFPSLDLLTFVPDNNAALYKEELRQNASRLIETLADFKIEAKVLDAKRGPTVTRYELQPGTGVKTSKIANLSDDIALHLAAPAVRIEAPIPGKSAIGIEIPNKTTSIVYLKEIIGSEEFAQSKSKVSVALGKSISGQPIVIDIAKMPHLLIAGVTGSGKSVCVNSILISLLYKATPDEVKLILVDPKVVELNVYNGIPHLLIPVVTDPNKAAGALNWAVGEMLQRYKMFADKGVRDFSGYNKTLREGETKLPQIVIIIDELADLMMAAKGDVEDSICRLAQMARAAGMHIVIATQRPSADVITGLIKSNIPSHIAFAVSSQINSHIILDSSGAEKLIGKGDMLYDPLGAAKPMRVQGCFVSDNEVENVVAFIKKGKENTYDDEVIRQIEQSVLEQKSGKGGGGDDDEADDPKLDEAIQCVLDKGQASTSMLQTHVGLGYPRAARVMQAMEKRGIIGPFQGSKPREVLITKAQWQEMKAKKE